MQGHKVLLSKLLIIKEFLKIDKVGKMYFPVNFSLAMDGRSLPGLRSVVDVSTVSDKLNLKLKITLSEMVDLQDITDECFVVLNDASACYLSERNLGFVFDCEIETH